MAYLELKNVKVEFGPSSNKTVILEDVCLSVKENEFVAIVGFSGSGKSTLMNLLSGLQKPTSGEVLFRGNKVLGPGPNLGMMFQNYSLLPWLSVGDNVKLAIKKVFPKLSKSEVSDKIEYYVQMVKLKDAIDKKPHELSGGMRQRASLARTLSLEPEVLLLDEPLSALDALTRSELQDHILNIWEKNKRTVVMITNDVDEAVLMADRIIPLTLAPSATLADEFTVDMLRPRDRHTLNDQPSFMKLKSELTNYMLSLGNQSRSQNSEISIPMPKIKPKDFNPPSVPMRFKQTQRNLSGPSNRGAA